jgi:hypothetical protein
VANCPRWNPVFHSAVNPASAADCPCWMALTDRSQADLTAGLLPAITLPELS